MVGNVCRRSGEEFALFVITDCNMLTFSSRSVCSKDDQERAEVYEGFKA